MLYDEGGEVKVLSLTTYIFTTFMLIIHTHTLTHPLNPLSYFPFPGLSSSPIGLSPNFSTCSLFSPALLLGSCFICSSAGPGSLVLCGFLDASEIGRDTDGLPPEGLPPSVPRWLFTSWPWALPDWGLPVVARR
jgi:hypothetical protein